MGKPAMTLVVQCEVRHNCVLLESSLNSVEGTLAGDTILLGKRVCCSVDCYVRLSDC